MPPDEPHRTNKKKKKGARGNSRRRKRRNQGQASVPNDIEEQLRRQRAQQQQQTQAAISNDSQSKHIEGYVYDPEREAYFPVDGNLFSNNEEETTQTVPSSTLPSASEPFPFHPLLMTRKRQSLMLSYEIIQNLVTISPWKRHLLRAEWAGHLLNNRYSVATTRNEVSYPVHLPPWCRTMDVGPNFRMIINRKGEASYQRDNFTLHNMPDCYHVRYLPQGNWAVVMATFSDQKSYIYLRNNTGHECERTVHGMANDVLCLSPETLLVATHYHSQGTGCVSGMSLERNRLLFRGFTDKRRSDALCMDTWSPHKVVLGHRNGDVSLLDVRTRRKLHTVSHDQIGNIMRIHALEERHVVVQTSHPDVGVGLALLDVRYQQLPVWRVPSITTQRHVMKRRRGMVVTPGVVCMPKLDQVGAWSTVTGRYLGVLSNGPILPADGWSEICALSSSEDEDFSARTWCADTGAQWIETRIDRGRPFRL